MKRTLVVVLVIVSMLSTLSFASADTNYWNDMRSVYEWDGVESDQKMEISIDVYDEFSGQYKIDMFSIGNLEDYSSYVELFVGDVNGELNIPDIKMYTNNSDIYINKEAILALLSAMDLAEDVDIKEEYILFRNETSNVDINRDFIYEILAFVEDMDLGVDLGMVQEGNTYTLELDSDKMIDLLDAYMRYIITNIDNLPEEFMQPGMEISAEEKAEVLREYNENVGPYKEIAKEFLKGSYYKSKTTIEEDRYGSDMETFIKAPMAEVKITSIANSKKIDLPEIQFPTSVKVVTEEDLQEFILKGIGFNENVGNMEVVEGELKAIIEMDGSYIKIDGFDAELGSLDLELKDGRSYVSVDEINNLLGIELDEEGQIGIKDLENYGYKVIWDGELKTISIYM